MIVDKNGNELQLGDMVKFVVHKHSPYEYGIILIIDESGDLFIECMGPSQHASKLAQNVEKILSLDDLF